MIVALAGTPAIAIALVVPAASPSGIARLTVPELTVTTPGIGVGAEPTDNKVPLIPATPPHTGPTGVIATVGFGLTVNVAQFETLVAGVNGEHVPPNIQRYP